LRELRRGVTARGGILEQLLEVLLAFLQVGDLAVHDFQLGLERLDLVLEMLDVARGKSLDAGVAALARAVRQRAHDGTVEHDRRERNRQRYEYDQPEHQGNLRAVMVA